MTIDFDISKHNADIDTIYPNLAKDMLEAPIIPVGDYQFRAYSFGERGTTINPALMKEVRNGLISAIDELNLSYSSLVSIHTTGALWASLVAVELEVPLHLFTQYPSNIIGQRKLIQTTGYYSREIYSPDMSQIDNCVIVDDVLSTGGTLETIVGGLREDGSNPLAAVCVTDKGGKAESLSGKLGLPIRCLMM